MPLALALLLCAWAAPAMAQAPAPLLEPLPATAAARGAAGRDARLASPRTRRTRRATLRLDRLEAALAAAARPGASAARPAFLLNLFDDAQWAAVLERVEADGFGHRTWAGHVDGDALSAVSLTVGAGAISGTVQVGNAIFRLEGGPADLRIDELDPAAFAAELPPLAADRADSRPPGAANAPTIAADGVPVADVLLLYTTDARIAQGGTAAVQAALAQGIADANTALVRSGVSGQLRVASMQEVAYTQSGLSIADDLAVLAETPAVAAMRDAAGADVVALIVPQAVGNACGVAYIGPAAAMPYSVTALPCLAQYTLAHEIAHNFGSDHAPGDSPPFGWRPYSYGYKDPAFPSPFRTVMAYGCATASCPRVLNFSSPRLVEPTSGRVTGTPSQDNAASLAEAFPIVAAFRATSGPLSAPLGVAVNVSGTVATLAWQAVGGATGYVVEAGSAPGAGNLFSGPVGAVTAVGASLPPGTYYARVRAVRGIELGPASPDVTIAVAPPVLPSAPGMPEVVVAGRTVTITWSAASGDVSGGYRLEAGYAPGASDAAIAVVPGGPVVASAVPPGTYVLRVRAIGAAGVGPPSLEVTVVVR